MNEEPVQEAEKDYQKYLGWKVPAFIKFVWVSLFIWIATYGAMYLIPNLKDWLYRD